MQREIQPGTFCVRKDWKTTVSEAMETYLGRLRLWLGGWNNQVRFGFFDDGVEDGWVADGEFTEHFAVELNSSGDERGDESIVMNAPCP